MMSYGLTDNGLNGINQKSVLQLFPKHLLSKDNRLANGTAIFPDIFKTDKLQDLIYNLEEGEDEKNNNKTTTQRSLPVKNGQHYPTLATKEKWLSTILDNTQHEQMIKDEIEARSEYVPNIPSLYRLPLDKEHCVSLNTDFGRHLLTSTLYKEKYGNIYFTLSQQFATQGDSMLCGPSSMVNILNALGVDPGRQWKYPWRWYDEGMLQKCAPTEHTHAIGCSLNMMACLAKNNGLSVDVVRASKDWTLENFRDDVKRSCSTFDQPIVLNFSRRTLNQTGSGHYSPIGAYNEEHDMVLVMEIARFKYPPFWTKLSKMWEAIQAIAVSRDGKVNSDMPRGYLILQKPKTDEDPITKIRLPWHNAVVRMEMLSNDDRLIHTMYAMKKVKTAWEAWLEQKIDNQIKEENVILLKAVDKIIEISTEIDPPVQRKQENGESSSRQELSKLDFPEAKKSSAFEIVQRRLQHIPAADVKHLKDILIQLLSLVEIPELEGSANSQADQHEINNDFPPYNDSQISAFPEELNKIAEVLTTMLLFWPYGMERPEPEITTNMYHMKAAVKPDMIHFPHNRVTSIPEQINTILRSLNHAGHEVTYGEKFVKL